MPSVTDGWPSRSSAKPIATTSSPMPIDAGIGERGRREPRPGDAQQCEVVADVDGDAASPRGARSPRPVAPGSAIASATTWALVTISPSDVVMIPVPIDSPASSPSPRSALIVTTDGPTASATAATSIRGRSPTAGRDVDRLAATERPAAQACGRRAACRSARRRHPPRTRPSPSRRPMPAASCHLVAGRRGAGQVRWTAGGGSGGGDGVDDGGASIVDRRLDRGSTSVGFESGRGARRAAFPSDRPCSLTAVGSSKGPSSPLSSVAVSSQLFHAHFAGPAPSCGALRNRNVRHRRSGGTSASAIC